MKQEKTVVPVKKNDDLLLEVTGLTGEGQGVARKDGFAVFVSGALPGETVNAHVIKVTGSYAVAKATEVVTASPERVTPRCPVFERCGGCALQHLAYPAQLRAKQRQVEDALRRLGGVADVPMREIIGMENPWHYRNKGSFPFGMAGNGVVFGFFAPRSHRLVPFADCPIQDARILDVAQRVASWANENRVSAYDEQTHTGSLRHVMVRVSAGGETMAVVVTCGKLKAKDALLSALEGVDSVWHNENSRDTNVILGDAFTLLGGKPTLTESIGELRFLVSPQSFLQVNAAQTAALYGTAVELLNPRPEETIVDAYCGIGTISLMLSKRCARVIGVEQVPEAVADAIKNAEINGIGNARFLCGAVEELLQKLICEGEGVSALVLDPPRKGCDERALLALIGSGVGRLVYVSCNPATLARDVKLLTERGFRLTAVQPVDMFPHTSSVETVALLTREPGED